MFRRVTLLGGGVLFLYAAMGALLYSQQRELIYFPTPPAEIDQYELREITAGSGDTIQVWRRNTGKARALIYLGGNAESLQATGALLRTLFPEYAIYLPLYPGYAGAPGEPNEQSLYDEALALYDDIEGRHSEISVIGRSLGSGVATYLAAERPLHKLALVTPFDSMQSLAQEVIPIYPMGLMLRDKYDSAARARQIDAPTLMIISGNDDIVTRPHSDRLKVAFGPDQVEQVVVEGSTHNNIHMKQEFAMALLLFFDQLHRRPQLQ